MAFFLESKQGKLDLWHHILDVHNPEHVDIWVPGACCEILGHLRVLIAKLGSICCIP